MPKKDGRELGQAEESWSRDKLSGKTARTQFIPVSCSVSTPPLKSCLDLIPLTWKVQVHPGEVSPSPPPPPSAAAKLIARNCNSPQTCQSALLTVSHLLFSSPFLLVDTHPGIDFYQETPYKNYLCACLHTSPSLQQAAAPSPLPNTEQKLG